MSTPRLLINGTPVRATERASRMTTIRNVVRHPRYWHGDNLPEPIAFAFAMGYLALWIVGAILMLLYAVAWIGGA